MTVITPTPPRERQPGPMPRGRVCAVESCSTVLSSWNPSETCGVHSGWAMGTVRGNSTDATSHDLAELLMEDG